MQMDSIYSQISRTLQTMVNDTHQAASDMRAEAEQVGGSGESERLAGNLVVALLNAKEIADQLMRRSSGRN